ncbi:MAG: oligopeptide/dipeptide ABC transporter ATP-binding protein [Actinomycetota bacterium]
MAGSGDAALRDRPNILLTVDDLRVEFPVGRRDVVHAVSGISFDVAEGETLGIVGESGCGKSTVARSIIRLNDIAGGRVDYQGHDLAQLEGKALRRLRPDLQMIFQDPISSLNPRRKIRDVISEGLTVWGRRKGTWSEARIDELMEAVGIDPAFGDRRPHQFSGGQCQRIGIARALALDPKVLICDEPVSALDVSVQAQVLNILEAMKARYGLTLLFISHDLSVVKNVSDRVMVMYLGKMCEIGNADEIYERPRHPYTRALLASIPEPAPTVDVAEGDIEGELPSPIHPPNGCRFNTRCPQATAICFDQEPVMRQVAGSDDHAVACHHPVTITGRRSSPAPATTEPGQEWAQTVLDDNVDASATAVTTRPSS